MLADYYDVYYRVHAEDYGWLGWAKNGEESGTSGLSKRLEAIQIVLVAKGGAVPGNVNGVVSNTNAISVTPSGNVYSSNDMSVKEDKVEINTANFPDNIFREFVSSNYDSDNDGYLSESELSTVTTMGVDNAGTGGVVKSLKGIEYFFALEDLKLYVLDCSVSDLDLSQNTNLKRLDVQGKYASPYGYGNDLSELDLSNNPNLVYVNCYGNNNLTSINLSNCTELVYLSCDHCCLASLDISSCSKLELLRCEDNNFVTLNLTNNSSLGYLSCDTSTVLYGNTLPLIETNYYGSIYGSKDVLYSLNPKYAF